MLFVSENWDWYESEIDMMNALVVVDAAEQELISIDVNEEEDWIRVKVNQEGDLLKGDRQWTSSLFKQK